MWISFDVSWFFISFLDLQKLAIYPYTLCEICFKSIHAQWPGFPGGSDGRKNLPAIRRPGFDPWVGKILHAMEQLSLCSTNTEPLLYSLGAATTEARRPQSLCSAAREAPTVRSLHTAKKSRPHSPPLEKSPSSSEDPAQPKINK